MRFESFDPLYTPAGSDIYTLNGFEPKVVDGGYLSDLELGFKPSDETLARLSRGSLDFISRLGDKTLLPRTRYSTSSADSINPKVEIHNYTGSCPTLTYEINPVLGCTVGCQYCLVSDGVHERELTVIDDYHLFVRELLDRENGPTSANREHYYYFSPKTEAFQEASLLSGVAHKVLREFIRHFNSCPDSKARLFIASKAGVKHLNIKHEGESILDLFNRIGNKMQFNTSVSIMPDYLRPLLEPYAAPMEERLAAVRLCAERGITACSALVQPIFIPCLTDTCIESFFKGLQDAGIINYKPEFLTVCPENLAMIGQLAGHFDKELERNLYKLYLDKGNDSHRKQRFRTAPDRDACKEALERMIAFTDSLGLSVSICYWVRKQLGISEESIPIVNHNGFQCLGYQRGLFL